MRTISTSTTTGTGTREETGGMFDIAGSGASGTAVAMAAMDGMADPLAHLPRSAITQYQKGDVIYDQDRPSTGLYLVIDGRVKVSRWTPYGGEVIVDIYQADDFFGESTFLKGADNPHGTVNEHAVAIEPTKVMSWTAAQVEELMLRRAVLAIALMRVLIRRNVEFTDRIESFGTDNIPRRLAKALIRFADRADLMYEDGSSYVPAYTHELIAQYVGTSREIVTSTMNRFRRDGMLRYSRKGIAIQRAKLQRWLNEE